MTNIDGFFQLMELLNASHEEVMNAGCALLSLLYGATVNDKLIHLRYSTYMHVTATKSASTTREAAANGERCSVSREQSTSIGIAMEMTFHDYGRYSEMGIYCSREKSRNGVGSFIAS
jgi:hypothetical protein